MPDDAPAAGTTDLLVVGGGRMGEALAAGLLRSGWPSGRLVVVEPSPARRDELAGTGLRVVASVAAALDTAAQGAQGGELGAVVAVKPSDVAAACRDLVPARPRRVLSIAAGVTIGELEAALGSGDGGGPAVLRAMPNTPALVGAGAAAVSPGGRAGADDVAWAEAVLSAVGSVVVLPEASLDAVTGLSGSGPAYVFLVAEALVDAGVLVGLPRPVARQLAVQTLLGSARLLAETGDEASSLRAAVTSPGGTTAAGLRALEAAGVRAAFLDAVAAATERARQLGNPPPPG